MPTTKDLALEPPRSPRVRLRHYVILGRTIDKCRALLADSIGEYHFDCPLDNTLFRFKGITGEDFKNYVAQDGSDEEIAVWVDKNGFYKTPEEIIAWSDQTEAVNPFHNPEMREWFTGECKRLNLNPSTTTLFAMLEADDDASFGSTDLVGKTMM